MRVIPVIDVRQGQVVHAIQGEREHYRPVTSVLTDSAEPRAVAAAFRDKLGLSEVYVADLDTIQAAHSGRWALSTRHREVLTSLAQQEGLHLLVDAAAADVPSALEVLATGASKAIIGAETLSAWEAIFTLPATLPIGRLVFSLDMRAGRVLSRCPQLAALSPLEALEQCAQAGWREVILLDLERVGTGAGVDRALIAAARERLPDLTLLIGGGIRNRDELHDLKALGVAAALIATALHQGTITAEDIAALKRDS